MRTPKVDYNNIPRIDLEYVSFGDRLREIRKERNMSQDEFAQLLGTSKQVLSRYETGQRAPKITLVQSLGDSAEEAAFNSLCDSDHPPFYKIFIDVTARMGLDIPGLVRVTGLTDKQIRTIIFRQMKDAPLRTALLLSDTLNVPLEVWTGDMAYHPKQISVEAYEVARAYDRASKRDRAIARMALDLEPAKDVKF